MAESAIKIKHKTYWERMLYEIQHRNSKNCYFTILPKRIIASDDSIREKSSNNKKHNVKIWLGKQFPDVYLTYQEARCTIYALQLKTCKAVATRMRISPRTVEYHLSEVKHKTKSTNKLELLTKIVKSDLLKNFKKMVRDSHY